MMRKVLVCEKTGLKKGSWTPEEDMLLSNYIKRYGHWNWGELPKYAGLQRCGKSCRLRWMNYLRPDIKRGKYSKEEEDLIIRLHREFGNKWSKIASSLPGRTDNEIKNHWHSHLKKRSEGKVKAKSKTVEREKPLVPICFFPNAPTPVILESSAVVSPPPLKSCYDDDDDDISTVTVELKL